MENQQLMGEKWVALPNAEATNCTIYSEELYKSKHLDTEEERLRTFKGWPSHAIRPNLLARHGFFYFGRFSEVQCCGCALKLQQWKACDDVLLEHRFRMPWCPFVMGLASPKHSGYVSFARRRVTYRNCPIALTHLKEAMVQAGFFYTGHFDRVLCFMCGNGLQLWELDDDPMELHAHYHPSCMYVRFIKYRDNLRASSR
ncbi:baculoviral IAP repeat-containing protein 3-like [Anopheles nili]|uniref:baculoviral IAP repeat-containing protein 3-like n=1 Tax=Anopheles nili TaxID=185578 RepID=UPI00237A91EE|nr:baculoviral IAP repeat-containing protein 3-like [Anopheles nili]